MCCFLDLCILPGLEKLNQNYPKIHVRFGSDQGQSTYYVFFGPASLCRVHVLYIQDSIRYPKYQNILCILDIFGYFKYDFGITDNFFISRFGSSVRVSDFGYNFKFYKIYFGYSDKILYIFDSSDKISGKILENSKVFQVCFRF